MPSCSHSKSCASADGRYCEHRCSTRNESSSSGVCCCNRRIHRIRLEVTAVLAVALISLVVVQVDSFNLFGFAGLRGKPISKQPQQWNKYFTHDQQQNLQKEENDASHYAFKLKRKYSDDEYQDEYGSNENDAYNLRDTMTIMSSLSPAASSKEDSSEMTNAMKDLEEQLDEQDEWLTNQQLMLDRIADDNGSVTATNSNTNFDITGSSNVAKTNQQYTFMPDASEGIGDGSGGSTSSSIGTENKKGSNGYQNDTSASISTPSMSPTKESEDPYDMDRRAESMKTTSSNNEKEEKKLFAISESEDPFEMGRSAAKQFLQTMQEEEEAPSKLQSTKEEETKKEVLNTVTLGSQEVLVPPTEQEEDEIPSMEAITSEETTTLNDYVESKKEVLLEKEEDVVQEEMEEQQKRIFVVGDQEIVVDNSTEEGKTDKEDTLPVVSSVSEASFAFEKSEDEDEEVAKLIVSGSSSSDEEVEDDSDTERKSIILPGGVVMTTTESDQEQGVVLPVVSKMSEQTLEPSSSTEPAQELEQLVESSKLKVEEEEEVADFIQEMELSKSELKPQDKLQPDLVTKEEKILPEGSLALQKEESVVAEDAVVETPSTIDLSTDDDAKTESLSPILDVITEEVSDSMIMKEDGMIAEDDTKKQFGRVVDESMDGNVATGVIVEDDTIATLSSDSGSSSTSSGDDNSNNKRDDTQQQTGSGSGTIEDVLVKVLEERKKLRDAVAEEEVKISTISSTQEDDDEQQVSFEEEVMEEGTFDEGDDGEGDDLFWDEGEEKEEGEEILGATASTGADIVTAGNDSKEEKDVNSEVTSNEDNTVSFESMTANDKDGEEGLVEQPVVNHLEQPVVNHLDGTDDDVIANEGKESKETDAKEKISSQINVVEDETKEEEIKEEKEEVEFVESSTGADSDDKNDEATLEKDETTSIMKDLLLTVADEDQQEEVSTILTNDDDDDDNKEEKVVDELVTEEKAKENIITTIKNQEEENVDEEVVVESTSSLQFPMEGEEDEQKLEDETTITATMSDEESLPTASTDEGASLSDVVMENKKDEEKNIAGELIASPLTTTTTATSITPATSRPSFVRTTPRITLEERFKTFSGSARTLSNNLVTVLSPNLSIRQLSELERSKLLKTAGVELTKSLLSTSRAAVLGVEAFVDVIGNSDSDIANDELKHSTVQMIQSYQTFGNTLSKKIKKESNGKSETSSDITEQWKNVLDTTSKSWNILSTQLDKSNAKRKATEALEETTKSLSTSTIALGVWGIRSVIDGIKSIQNSVEESQEMERINRRRTFEKQRQSEKEVQDAEKLQDETNDIIEQFKLEASQRLLEKKKDILKQETKALQNETAQLIEKTKARKVKENVPPSSSSSSSYVDTSSTTIMPETDNDGTITKSNEEEKIDNDVESSHPFLPELVAEEEEVDYLELERSDDKHEPSVTSLPTGDNTKKDGTLISTACDPTADTVVVASAEKDVDGSKEISDETPKKKFEKDIEQHEVPSASTTKIQDEKTLPFFAKRVN